MATEHDLTVPGLGESQRRVLLELKRRGPSTLAEIGESIDLAAGTLREHLGSLEARDLVARAGTRRNGPGRPAVVYGLTERGDSLFPKGEAELLTELVEYLLRTGNRRLLEDFFEARVEARRPEAEARVEGLSGRARREAVAELLSEAGFMAEIVSPEDARDEPGDPAAPLLRLCHCPLRSVVSVTKLPCQAELRMVKELLGRDLERVTWMPAGDESCSYRIVEG